MKRIILMYCALALLSVPCWAQGVFEKENIFAPLERHCHSSSIVETPGGDLLVCWFQGSGERWADDVVVNGARLESGTAAWSPVFLMADTPGFPDCNPVLAVDPEERLWLYWIPVLANRWECGLLKYRRAEDYEGPGAPNWSWQDVITLKPGDAFAEVMKEKFDEIGFEEGMWANHAPPYRTMLEEAAKDKFKRQMGWMTRIHPLVLPSGRTLLPLYSDGFNMSLIAISDDMGETWRASAPIVGLGPTQPSLVLKKDGTIVAYLRDEGSLPARMQIATSKDDGETWTPASDLDIPNPSSSVEVIKLESGLWVMVCNDTEDTRARLVAMGSDDEGATWKWRRILEMPEDDFDAFSYPSVIQSRDGRIHATYSCGGKGKGTIRHSVFDEAWLRAGE